MEVWVDSKQVECSSKTIMEFNDFWKKTTRNILQQNRFLYFVKIDDELYYDGYEAQIINHFDSIQRIVIETKSEDEALEETIVQIRDYNQKLIESTDKISSFFYGEPDSEQWAMFAQYIDGIQWMSQSLHFIQTIFKKKSANHTMANSIEILIASMTKKIELLQAAADQKDYVLMGDIIQYELPDFFQQIHHEFGGSA